MARDRSKQRIEAKVQGKTGGKRLKIILGSLFLIALCGVIRYYWAAPPASADSTDRAMSRSEESSTLRVRPSTGDRSRPAQTQTAPKKSGPASIPDVVATVNSRRITRRDLARECLFHYGEDVLDSLVNKRLINQACRSRRITVTDQEVKEEVERMAKRFSIPVEQWLKMLERERNVTAEQYADDIIWPTLALRKLAGNKLTVSHEELVAEYETCYGEAVRARLIAVSDPEKANKLRAQAVAHPKQFGNLAKDYSEDAPSASVKGIIQPIRKHGTYPEIEKAVFNMADGDVSPVIHAGGQYVIIKREGVIPARQVAFDQVAPQLEELIRDRNMRGVAQKVFDQLQSRAKIENIWNDPVKHKQMPGVAALVNGEQVSVSDLADECLARHGRETLEGMISRQVLEQACEKRGITVTEQDMQAEIARAALDGTLPKADGSPDIKAWLELVKKNQGVSEAIYRHDAVWPTVALKKLVGDKVQITEDDLHKGFEANYGQRVRCLAIVLDNFRRAQQVWQMARNKNTAEYFGDLAGEYSVEPGSQALRGEIPPIKRYGGQPQIEDEAFALRPGALSGIIQLADKFVILRCEGFTEPINVKFAEVRDKIYRDLHEKKLRLAMANYFDKLQDSATVDNYLTGESHAPKQPQQAAPAANIPTFRQVPSG